MVSKNFANWFCSLGCSTLLGKGSCVVSSYSVSAVLSSTFTGQCLVCSGKFALVVKSTGCVGDGENSFTSSFTLLLAGAMYFSGFAT